MAEQLALVDPPEKLREVVHGRLVQQLRRPVQRLHRHRGAVGRGQARPVLRQVGQDERGACERRGVDDDEPVTPGPRGE